MLPLDFSVRNQCLRMSGPPRACRPNSPGASPLLTSYRPQSYASMSIRARCIPQKLLETASTCRVLVKRQHVIAHVIASVHDHTSPCADAPPVPRTLCRDAGMTSIVVYIEHCSSGAWYPC